MTQSIRYWAWSEVVKNSISSYCFWGNPEWYTQTFLAGCWVYSITLPLLAIPRHLSTSFHMPGSLCFVTGMKEKERPRKRKERMARGFVICSFFGPLVRSWQKLVSVDMHKFLKLFNKKHIWVSRDQEGTDEEISGTKGKESLPFTSE